MAHPSRRPEPGGIGSSAPELQPNHPIELA
jgi:hypothetical protein